MLRIAIGDGSDAYRAALSAVLAHEPGLRCVGEADTVDGLIEEIERGAAEVAVLDANLPGGGVTSLAARLHANKICCRVVAVTAMPSSEGQRVALRAGAVGLIAKSDGPEILAALRSPAA